MNTMHSAIAKQSQLRHKNLTNKWSPSVGVGVGLSSYAQGSIK